MSERIRSLWKQHRPWLIPAVVYGGLWALFFWRLLTPNLGDRLIFLEGDFTQHYYAFAARAGDRIWQGAIPLWDMYNHAGAPFAASVQWATWYPLQWIAILLSGSDGLTIEAYQFLNAAHVYVAAMLTYLFLWVRLHKIGPALVGGLLFGFGGYVTGYPILQPSVMMAAVWLPLMLLGVYLSVTRPRWRVAGVALTGLGMAISLFGGHPQTTMYLTYATGLYLLYLGWRDGLRWHAILWRGVVFAAVGIGLAAVQLAPALEYIERTSRVVSYTYADKQNGFAWVEFTMLIFPSLTGQWTPLYTGTGGILLAIGALLRPIEQATRKTSARYFWLLLAIGFGALTLGGKSMAYDAAYAVLPGFDTFRAQERAAVVVVFALVVLAADMLDGLLTHDRIAPVHDQRVKRLTAAYPVVILLMLLGIIMVREVPPRALFADEIANMLIFVGINAAIFALWLRWSMTKRSPNWLLTIALMALLTFDLFTVGSGMADNYRPDVPENRVAPPAEIERLTEQGEAVLWRVDGANNLQGYGEYWRIPDIYGTGPFTLDRIHALRQIPVNRFWEVLAVHYVSLPVDVVPPVPATRITEATNYAGQPYVLYELDDPRPFAVLVYGSRDSSGSDDYAHEIMADPRVELRAMAVTQHPVDAGLSGTRPAGAVVESIERPAPERVEVVYTSPEPAIITLAMTHYPGWRVVVDGAQTDIIDCYAGLICAAVPAGDSVSVTLRFQPRRVWLGGMVSIFTLLVMIAASIWAWRRIDRTNFA